MSYFDGFLAAVPVANKADYIRQATDAWERIFRDMGALSMTETWADDVPDGEVTSFPMAVKKKDDEAVIFSWVEWPDKATRDAAWKKMMEMGPDAMGEMPFDGKRMMYGGFQPIVEVRA